MLQTVVFQLPASGGMAAIAGTTFIYVSPNVLVPGIGPRLRMFVAVDARESGVVRLVCVTVGAGIPYARTMPVAGMDRKVWVGIERRGLPGQRPVADRALGVESGGNVVRILRRCVSILMAGNAFYRRPAIAVARVAAQAWDRLVRSARGELSQVVVETRLPRRSVVAVALDTVCSETGQPVIDRNRRVVIFPVA
jgi:hypothetical protein